MSATGLSSPGGDPPGSTPVNSRPSGVPLLRRSAMMRGMSSWNKWWGRLSTVLGAVVLSVFVPVAAWASTGPGELVVEAAKRRRGGGVGFLGLLCCLVVVGGIVVLVLLLMRNRRNRPPR